MAENKPTKRETKAQKSRQAILDATMCCLVKYGYSETSTSRVCEEAGCRAVRSRIILRPRRR